MAELSEIFKNLVEAMKEENTIKVFQYVSGKKKNRVFPLPKYVGDTGSGDYDPFEGIDEDHYFLKQATPLIIAIYANKLEIVDMLLEIGADMNLSFESGDGKVNYTALVLAIDLGRTEIVQRLLAEKDIDVNPKITAPGTFPDEFPLQMAIRTRQPEIAKMLLVRGADVNAKDRNGRTALDYAEGVAGTGMVRDEECVSVLTDAGAVPAVPAVPAAVGPARGGAGGPSRSRSKRTRSNRRRASRHRTRKN